MFEQKRYAREIKEALDLVKSYQVNKIARNIFILQGKFSFDDNLFDGFFRWL
jgi:hypothetical protein